MHFWSLKTKTAFSNYNNLFICYLISIPGRRHCKIAKTLKISKLSAVFLLLQRFNWDIWMAAVMKVFDRFWFCFHILVTSKKNFINFHCRQVKKNVYDETALYLCTLMIIEERSYPLLLINMVSRLYNEVLWNPDCRIKNREMININVFTETFLFCTKIVCILLYIKYSESTILKLLYQWLWGIVIQWLAFW